MEEENGDTEPIEEINNQQRQFVSQKMDTEKVNSNGTAPTEEHVQPTLSTKEQIEKHLSKLQKYMDEKEVFGLNLPFVVNHNQFFQKNRFEKYWEYLELGEPVKIRSGFVLMKVGFPYLPASAIQNNAISGTGNGAQSAPLTSQQPQASTIAPIQGSRQGRQYNHGFLSLRKADSLFSTGLKVYYLQAVVYVPALRETLYVVVPEDAQEKIFFHTNLKSLLVWLEGHILERQIEQRGYTNYCRRYCKKALFAQISIEIFQKRLSLLYRSGRENEINTETLARESLPPPETLFDKNTLEQAVTTHLQKMCAAFKFQQLTMGDLLFGYFHPKIYLMLKLAMRNHVYNEQDFPQRFKDYLTKRNFSNVPERLSIEDYNIKEIVNAQHCPVPSFYRCRRSFMDKDNPFRERELCLAIQLTKKPHFFKKNSKQQDSEADLKQIPENKMHKYTLQYFVGDHAEVRKEFKRNKNRLKMFDSAQNCWNQLFAELRENNAANGRVLLQYLLNFITQELRTYTNQPRWVKLMQCMYFASERKIERSPEEQAFVQQEVEHANQQAQEENPPLQASEILRNFTQTDSLEITNFKEQGRFFLTQEPRRLQQNTQ